MTNPIPARIGSLQHPTAMIPASSILTKKQSFVIPSLALAIAMNLALALAPASSRAAETKPKTGTVEATPTEKTAPNPALLDKLLRYPGNYSQICDARSSPFPAPIPGFRTLMHGEAGFSEKNILTAKKNRAALLPAIAAKLEKLDPSQKPVPQPPDPSIPKDQIDVEPVGADPAVFSTLLLSLIEELNATEVFPQLLAFEEKYHTSLTVAEKDSKLPLPQADGADGAGVGVANLLKENEDYEKLSPERAAEIERTTAVFQAQAIQRDILAVFVRAMRKDGFEPMMQSELEKTYGRLLKEKWGAHEDFSKYKSAADIPEDSRDSVKFDPIHKVAYLMWDPVEIPYTEETRQTILTLTQQFLASSKK
ncbi:MAG: hypothetical protein JWL81_997 [Verrucomicrobiales bacterium]|nr:hypothetical protein [Verrucomicrobiales bacterium]